MVHTSTIGLILLALLWFPAPARAQTEAPKAPPPCQADGHFRDFDFWLGTWRVSSRASGEFAGANRIEAIENGCAIAEHWQGKNGGTGQSLNYYNPVTGKWRQIWVAAGNYSIDIAGGLKDGSMVLEGTIWGYESGTEAPFRGAWTPNADGSVRQFFEQRDGESGDWKPWFDGLYVKSETE